MLKGGLIDLAVVTTPIERSAELSQRDLKAFSEVAVVGDAFEDLASGDPISLRRLADYPIISLGAHTATYEFYSQQFLQAQIPYHADIEAATADQILPLIQHNLGIGFVPEEFLSENPTGCHRIPLETELPPREISLVKRKKHTLPPPAAELEKMILESIQVH